MGLGIKNVIMANHMISLITSSTTDPCLSEVGYSSLLINSLNVTFFVPVTI
jgi:hypothetical protein